MTHTRQPLRVAAALGPLETRVMDVIWAQSGARSVREVRDSLAGGSAYTTVMTTLDRLYKKGLLARRRDGPGYVYSALFSRSDLSRRRAAAFVETLLGSEPHPVLSAIVDAVSESDRAMLDELEHLVRRKRRELREGEP